MAAAKFLSLIGAFGIAVIAAGAEAAPTNPLSGTTLKTGVIGSATYTLLCPGGCTYIGEAVNPNANETTEVNTLNLLLGGTTDPQSPFTTAAVSKVDTGSSTGISFDIFGPYFWLKIDGPNAGTVYFSSQGAQTVAYTGVSGPAGLSHYAQVPIPGAAMLLLTALGGLVGWRRWGNSGAGAEPQMA